MRRVCRRDKASTGEHTYTHFECIRHAGRPGIAACPDDLQCNVRWTRDFDVAYQLSWLARAVVDAVAAAVAAVAAAVAV